MIIKRVFTLVILLNISVMFGEGISKDDVADVSKIQLEKLDFKIVKKVPLSGGGSVEYGEFVLDVGLYRNETVKVHYGIMLDKDGTPGANADNIVFYAPFMPERKFNSKNEFKWFPETAGKDLVQPKMRVFNQFYSRIDGVASLLLAINNVTTLSSSVTKYIPTGCHNCQSKTVSSSCPHPPHPLVAVIVI